MERVVTKPVRFISDAGDLTPFKSKYYTYTYEDSAIIMKILTMILPIVLTCFIHINLILVTPPGCNYS